MAQKAPVRYHWLLFDADGTLFDFHRAEGVALAEAFRRAHLPFESRYLEAYRQINLETWRELERGLITPEQLKLRRFERFFDHIGIRHGPAAFSNLYLESLAGCPDLLEGAHEVLQRLHAHYRIAILTNGLTAVQRPRLEASLIRDFVADIVISEEVGFAKPDPRYFDVAFERLGHPDKRAVLFIGDSWSSDIVGGAGYGIDTCWFNPKGQPRPAEPGITRELRSMAELEAWLGG